MDSDQARRDAGAAIFAQDDVAASYYARPPYPPALYDALLAQTPGRARALDIGCGPGKVARVLADHFGEVVALDPSAPMIAAGKAADAGAHGNIVWVQARAEDYDDPGTFDLATFGASIHWTDPAALFPKLARWTPLVALLNDAPTFPAPAPPCGHDAWIDFLALWFERTGRRIPEAWRTPNPDAWAPLGPHGAWLDILGRRRFTATFRQSVEDFVIGNHARMNWNRRMMGPATVTAFDAALDALMRPFAADGMLTLDVASELLWGAPRASPRL
jgi:SAM-dependent methyltransferase